jgi:Mg/Co/Ni transporter MgtE
MSILNLCVGEVVVVTRETSVQDVAVLMQARGVVDDSNYLCGVVSTDDLVRFVASEMTKIGSLFQEQTGTSLRHRTHEFTRMA